MVAQIENILKEKLNEDSESYFVQANIKEGSQTAQILVLHCQDDG